MLWTVRRLDPGTLHQHIDPMFRAAWALTGSREDAEDLVQDTFTKVLSRPRMVRGDERGYLLQALRNTFYTRVRTASRRPQTTTMPEGAEPADPRAPAPQLAAEVNEVLEAVSELPEDFRLALVAVDILGLRHLLGQRRHFGIECCQKSAHKLAVCCRDTAQDDIERLDVVGAFVDWQDLDVAQHCLDAIVLNVAVATQGLHGRRGDFHATFAGDSLGQGH